MASYSIGEDGAHGIKKLGFGLMRLPKAGEAIDVEQTKQMVDLFMDAGFTYFDTAWAYAGSEDAIREALVERYPRESFQLATKAAPWIGCESREDAVAQLETSLKQTGAGYFDFYLLHNLGEFRTHFFDQWGMWDWIAEKKAEGVIRHAGFSFHSTPEELDELLSAHPEMEFVQLQINYADWDNPAVQSRRCYEVARKHHKPVIIMEPVKGGMLANPPEQVANVLKAAEPNSSVASWAIRFAASLPGVITVLSGMSDVAQVQDNLSYMRTFETLTDAQHATIERAQHELAKIPLIPCTRCNYCAKVCPNEIGISGTFTAMNMHTLYGDLETAKKERTWQVDRHGKRPADDCIKCGRCEQACPQHIKIRDELARSIELFGPAEKA
ncbi:aldo/keto reductase [uncultured Parolsenella sp.]|uniref:aldo/keto reductase n=1 Tax=uncultured Parolsenella sp. TaxID=2083008 RepID=UPI0027DE1198|nr:aldo/keto reductase [uncultured Parolsenella sp.]